MRMIRRLATGVMVLVVLALSIVSLTDHPLSAISNQAAPSPEVVAYWSFDEREGDIVFDHSGYMNHGVVSEAEWVGGKSVSALEFTDQSRLSIPYGRSLEPDQISVSMWVYPKPTKKQVYGFIRKDRGYGDGWRLLYDYRGANGRAYLQVNFGDDNPRLLHSNADFSDRWTHLAWTYDGRQVRLYVNGELDASYEERRAINYQGSGIVIGFLNQGFVLDEVCLYKGVINDGKINQLLRGNECS